MKFEDLIGKRYTRLVVVSRAESNKYGHPRWNCLCDCGNMVVALSSDLKRGGRPSCGCLKSEKISELRKLEPGKAAFNFLFAQYKKGARERELSFSLTANDFALLIDKNCHYCGRLPNLKVYNDRMLLDKGVNGNFIYSGIDRKDSMLGYHIDNCVTCCKTCNFAKNDMSYEDFIKYLDDLTVFRSTLAAEGAK